MTQFKLVKCAAQSVASVGRVLRYNMGTGSSNQSSWESMPDSWNPSNYFSGLAGSNISQTTNASNQCIYSKCNASCQIEQIQDRCVGLAGVESHSTYTPLSTTTVSTSQIPLVTDCFDLLPPRKVSEQK